ITIRFSDGTLIIWAALGCLFWPRFTTRRSLAAYGRRGPASRSTQRQSCWLTAYGCISIQDSALSFTAFWDSFWLPCWCFARTLPTTAGGRGGSRQTANGPMADRFCSGAEGALACPCASRGVAGIRGREAGP